VLGRLEAFGLTPTPPYIRTPVADPGRYQTTYARRTGSAAAPTAGLHFTPELDGRLAADGVEVVAVTLHVGLGTFKPLQEERLADNRLHSEVYEVEAAVWRQVQDAHAAGRRVVAVGTTTVRVLEHLALGAPLRGETDLFIVPGFTPRVVGALLTNFHLPRTSLLALVMAFAGVGATRAAYEHAVRERYRFFSFGDAMLVV
jgi:S-adenosylmethionine:tRNA ribosyltransferase-isomerase